MHQDVIYSMSYGELAGLISVGLGLLVSIAYWVSIYRGKVRPHLFSWIIWTLLALVGAAAQIIAGAGPGAWASVLAAWTCLMTIFVALFRGERHVTRNDWICLAGALLALPVWILTHSPLCAVVIISVVGVFSLLPTWRQLWAKPQGESLTLHGLTAIKLAVSLYAVDQMNVTTMLYPASLMSMCILFVGVGAIRRGQMKAT